MSRPDPPSERFIPPTGFKRAKTIALDAGRHALPLVPFYVTRGNGTSYLLLTAFDLSLGLMLIVGTTRDVKDPTTVDPRAAWLISRAVATLVLSAFLGIFAAILSIPLGIPAFIFGMATGVNWNALVSRPGFWIPAAIMMLATGARAQRSFEAVTTVGKRGTSPHAAPIVGNLEQDRRHSKANYAAQVTLIATYAALSYGLSIFGRRGFFVFPALFAGLLVFYDARPDIGQRISPRSGAKRSRSGSSGASFLNRLQNFCDDFGARFRAEVAFAVHAHAGRV